MSQDTYGLRLPPSLDLSFGLPAASTGANNAVNATGLVDFRASDLMQDPMAGMMPVGVIPSGGAETSGFTPGFMDKAFGYTNPDTGASFGGWAPVALGGLGQLVNGFMAMKNYGLAKDQLRFQKDAYTKNYENQRKLTNMELADREERRRAARGMAFDRQAWLKENGI